MKKVILPVLVGIAGLALLLLAVGGALDVSNKPVFIQGEIDATRVDVSAKISGRVAEQAVRDGAQVATGELLLVLDSPELQALKSSAFSFYFIIYQLNQLFVQFPHI